VVVVIVAAVVLGLIVAPIAIFAFDRAGRLSTDLKRELWKRYIGSLVMAPLVLIPTLMGAAWTILGVAVLSLLCCRECAAATGLFREKIMSVLVIAGILGVTFAIADNWYRLFVAMTPISLVVITAAATSLDRPSGYIQRVALSMFGFLLFGIC